MGEVEREFPLFPLGLVALPFEFVPLHVFEPRYRALVAHCLATHATMGIATLKPGYEANYDGKPDIWPTIGVGLLADPLVALVM